MSAGQNFISAKSKAAMGLALIKEAILDHLEGRRDGLRNAYLAHDLGLESDHEGQQKDYLTYSVLGLLLREHQVEKMKHGRKVYYVRAPFT
jgi:uncharacterized protein